VGGLNDCFALDVFGKIQLRAILCFQYNFAVLLINQYRQYIYFSCLLYVKYVQAGITLATEKTV